ncbi:beta-ketoacyl-ACP synthase I [Aliikangiella coralliicola]|uniref:3-oxoacyl-[acyl-carrier-protein] synthase 1 n=1 Tax=Aliikangiella coralliicola TaxID=2592383 RepID=A0A545UAM3_9GAMM|nr:beta-ketoacyl-ACP synthase I [Aliikangiella coralliicola]TQV86516.1 beta-ketoacyl-ACP synthase I [Aliikangiella coralliicola]
MKRVVVTGMGIVSCLGNDIDSVADSLKQSRSGIRFIEKYKEVGLRSLVAGRPDIEVKEHIDRKVLRFMGDAAAYAYISMKQAIEDAKLTDDLVSNPRTGVIMGSGGGSQKHQVESVNICLEKGVKRVGPYAVPKTMASTTSACLATPYKIKGVNYSITSACATSAHCIGNAFEQIQLGKQDIMFAGGGEEEDWRLTLLFDAMGALSSKYNDTPETASRPYDETRDGFVISSGGGTLVLEELEHAKARGAKIYAEVVGYGATSDGYDMVAPSGEGAVRCMQQALATVDGNIDYINTHGTSTPVGDTAELSAIKETFVDYLPKISSTKSLAGHSLGATGVHEAIYSLIMMERGFIAGSANINQLDPDADGLPIVQKSEDAQLNRVLSNSFGFGGTNASLVFEKYKG